MQERSEGGFSRYHGGQTEAGGRPKGATTKGSRELREKSFHYLLEKRGGCYSGQALVCAITVAHIAFFVHKSVAQHSDKQHTLALTACSQHGVLGGCGVCSKLRAFA